MTPEGFAIRAALPADAPALARLRLDLRTELGEATEQAAAFLARCSRWMADHLTRPTLWHCLLAEAAGDLQASLWLQLIEKIPNPVGEPELLAYLTNFYVRPAARGQGLGDRMLTEALDWCTARRVHIVLLWPSARSRSLYTRHGFAPGGDLFQQRLPRAAG